MSEKAKTQGENVHTRADAETWLRFMCGSMGGGFHPDTPIADYRPAFPADFVTRHERIRRQVFRVLGAEVYEVALGIATEMWGGDEA